MTQTPLFHSTARLDRHANGEATVGPGRHRRYRGFHVLQLAGGPYEMGFQHGSLLKSYIPSGPLSFYGRYLQTLVQMLFRRSGLRPLGPVVGRLIEATILPRLVDRIPAYARAAIAGMCDGAGLPEASTLKACVVADAVACLLSTYGRLTRRPVAPGCPYTPPFGCSSAVAGVSATLRKQLLHGRNLDFMGVGRWDAQPVVAFHAPESGLRYASITSAGLLGGGLTGMNASGVTCAVHMHFPREIDLTGVPLGSVGDLVLRQARCVDDAIAILDRYRPISAWTYVVADPHRAIAYEVAPGLRRIVEMSGDLLGYANAYVHPDFQRIEHDVYPAFRLANHARHHRLQALLRARSGEHTEQGIGAILCDRYDAELERETEIGNSLRTPYTVSSVIFRPADRRFWVGQGPAPTSAGPYVGFDLRAAGPSGKPKVLPGPEPRSSDGLRALDAYCMAIRAYSELYDLAATRAHLSTALSLRPNDALYQHVAGLLALKAGEPVEALEHLQKAVEIGQRPARQARMHVSLGWTLDLLGRRSEAQVEYRAGLERAEEGEVRAAAKAGAKRRFTHSRARQIEIELVFGDVV